MQQNFNKIITLKLNMQGIKSTINHNKCILEKQVFPKRYCP